MTDFKGKMSAKEAVLDGQVIFLSLLSKGMTYIVSDDLSIHRSKTENGVKLLIIDGDFLKRF